MHARGGGDCDPMRAWLERIRRDARVPGIAVSVRGAKHRADWYVSGQGADAARVPPDFELGCIAKLLLGVVALDMAHRGGVDLDDPVAAHVPELVRTALGRHVRVRHLLSHSSGYRGLGPGGAEFGARGWPEICERLRRAPLLFRPGSVVNYEHSETRILERVLENASGRRCAALIRDTILQPLGIDAGRRADPLSLPVATLCALAAALMGIGPNSGALSRAFERMRAREVELPAMIGGPQVARMPVAFGLGIAHLRHGWLGASGMGERQCLALRCHVPSATAVVVAIDALAPELRDSVLHAVCASLAGEPPPAAPSRLPCGLAALDGDYVGGCGSRLAARFAAGRLQLEISSGRADRVLRAELGVGPRGEPRLESPVPQLGVGIIAPRRSGIGLMMGLSAFRRIGLPVSMSNTEIEQFN